MQVSVDVSRLLSDIIHQKILAERVRRGEVGLAAAELRDFLHEVDQAVITGEHKGVNQDSSTLAFSHFFERLRHHKRIETERVLINASVFESERVRFAV